MGGIILGTGLAGSPGINKIFIVGGAALAAGFT